MSELETMRKSSALSGCNQLYVDELYEAYLRDPKAVDAQWQHYFASLGQGCDVSHAAIKSYFQDHTRALHQSMTPQPSQHAHLLELIQAYRSHGHHHAKLDPLNITERRQIPDLDWSYHGFTESDLDSVKLDMDIPLAAAGTTLRELHRILEHTYAGTIGIEYLHITSPQQVEWLQQRFEPTESRPKLDASTQKMILKHLTAAEGLEKYLGSKYVGQKRFSLEGCESLIPMLHHLIERASQQSVKELVLGMAHRGRLNVLVNVLGKKPDQLFQEFEGQFDTGDLSGDVKYHMGFSANIETSAGSLHVALAFNPSHLEIISPVVEGSVRARQRRRVDQTNRTQVVPVIIHGDAAFCGQGVIQETMNFSQAPGYATGGTVHIIINNQIGFTTSNPVDTRSTLYCTDVAKTIQAPIFHVNADDPEAVLWVMEMAFDYRMTFGQDVVVDLVCYRRHGHNEADDPSVTQPMMYQVIKSLPTTLSLYTQTLQQQQVIDEQESKQLAQQYRDGLDRGQAFVITSTDHMEDEFIVDWRPFLDRQWTEPCDTTVDIEVLQKLATRLHQLPPDFHPHPMVRRLLGERQKMMQGDLLVNWGLAETLAYASLLEEGYGVRLSGQDCGRGTFAHRHAALHDHQTGSIHVPLAQLSQQQEQFIVIDSTLSEEAVLAFDYGFATAAPDCLTIWEAQFGDFANGAQVVIDQFISSGEQKWGRLCGLVMLLPHGYEGQGPEHSSARLERFLQLCAQHNMQICVPTTPAQAFHMLRRQMVRLYRKPLVVMTPKSLLRHKLATSKLEALADGQFQVVLPEMDALDPHKVRRIILCSGKVYYDLLQHRRKHQIDDAAIIRLEQLYPFPEDTLRQEMAVYPQAADVIWCQEEPKNQGAWYASNHHMQSCLRPGQKLLYVGREQFAAPAVGSPILHKKQQDQLVQDAFELSTI